MKLEKLEWQNFNSYGNKIQTLEFPETGQLIGLFGKNGDGKSTIKQVLELCLFGKAQGKSGNRLSLKKLPNRRNRALYAGAWFKNNKQDDVNIKIFLEPNKVEIYKNDQIYTDEYKKLSPKEKEQLIGFSYSVFKSFISLNINDFKNFISLTTEDKKNLLNKLFNIDELDTFLSIVKELDKANQKNIEFYQNLIENNKYQINDYSNIIKSYENIDRVERMSEIKNLLLEKKPIFDSLVLQITEQDNKLKEIANNIRNLAELKVQKEKEHSKNELIINNLNEKIKNFELGKCAICETDLTDNNHKEHLNELILNKESMINVNKKIMEYLTRVAIEDVSNRNLNQIEYKKKSDLSEELSELKIELGGLKKEYSYLKEQENIESKPITEIENSMNVLINKNKEYDELLKNYSSKVEIYEELKALFSGEGIRKNIIKNIIKPINNYLSDFLIKLESRYKAVLNDNFDASLYELEILEIDPETASKGEDRKINLAIALSYLKLILELNHSNILFLDEVFDGIDPGNVDITLKILKEMAIENKLNIICVHHGMNKIEHFDRVITVNRDVFSDIEDITLK